MGLPPQLQFDSDLVVYSLHFGPALPWRLPSWLSPRLNGRLPQRHLEISEFPVSCLDQGVIALVSSIDIS
jgi:hypothetical protein